MRVMRLRSNTLFLLCLAAAACEGPRGDDPKGSKKDPIVIDLADAPGGEYACGVNPLARTIGDERVYFELRNRGLMNTATVEAATQEVRLICYSDDAFTIEEDLDGPGLEVYCGIFDDQLPFYFVVDATISGGASYDLCFFQD